MDSRQARLERRLAAARNSAERAAAGRNTTGLARWRRFRRRVGSWLLDLLAPWLLRLIAATWRVQRLGDAGLTTLRGDGPWIVAMWHGRMLCLMPMSLHKGRGIRVLVSPSDDGGLATKALRNFRYDVIRGSLSRGGARAFREMTVSLCSGRPLVVTPDGPRGPRHSMNVGVAWLARDTQAPILTVGVACDRAWRLRSWDRFTIPKPFARLAVSYADPVHIAAGTNDAELETIAAAMRERLLAQERECFARLGITPDLDGEAATPKRCDPDTARAETGSREAGTS